MNNSQLYVFAQDPPTPEGIICPVQAGSVEHAILEAQQILGVVLRRLGGGKYSDGTREFFLYFGERGMEQFAALFGTEKVITPRFPLGRLVATPGAIEAM